jgi:hypothetical protein
LFDLKLRLQCLVNACLYKNGNHLTHPLPR